MACIVDGGPRGLELLFYPDEQTRTVGLYPMFIHNIYPLKLFLACFVAKECGERTVTWSEIAPRRATGVFV